MAALLRCAAFLVLLGASLPVADGAAIAAPIPVPSNFRYGPAAPGGPVRDRVGLSPNNACVPESEQYFYRVQIRDATDSPIPNAFIPGLVLDFGACLEPNSRPVPLIPPDVPVTSAQGVLEWRRNLSSGGADPCSVRVLLNGVPLHVIRGGIPSPDQNGNGVVEPLDMEIWRLARDLQDPPWRGDLGASQAFDDLATPADSTLLQHHLDCPVYYRAIIDQDGVPIVTAMAVYDSAHLKIHAVISSAEGFALESDSLVDLGAGRLGAEVSAMVPTGAGRSIEIFSRFEDSEERDDPIHTDSLSVLLARGASVAAWPRAGPAPPRDPYDLDVKVKTEADLTRGQVESTVKADLTSQGADGSPRATVDITASRRTPSPDDKLKVGAKVAMESKDGTTSAAVQYSKTTDAQRATQEMKGRLSFGNARSKVDLSGSHYEGLGGATNAVSVAAKVTVTKGMDLEIEARAADGPGVDERKGSLIVTKRLFDFGPGEGVTARMEIEHDFNTDRTVNRFAISVLGFRFEPGEGPLDPVPWAAYVTSQDTVCCNGVCSVGPVREEWLNLGNGCWDVTAREGFAEVSCAPTDTLSAEAGPCVALGVPPPEQTALELALEPAHPNPSGGVVRLAYTLAAAGRTRLEIFDIRGSRVRLLADQWQEPGRHALRWDGRDDQSSACPAGVYFVRVEAGLATRMRKVVLMR